MTFSYRYFLSQNTNSSLCRLTLKSGCGCIGRNSLTSSWSSTVWSPALYLAGRAAQPTRNTDVWIASPAGSAVKIASFTSMHATPFTEFRYAPCSLFGFWHPLSILPEMGWQFLYRNVSLSPRCILSTRPYHRRSMCPSLGTNQPHSL